MNKSDISPLNALDLGSLIRILLMNSKLVLTITSIVFSLWLVYFFTSTNVYRIESLVQIEPTSPIGGSQEVYGAIVGGNNAATIENQVLLYKTRSNLNELIKSLNLNYEFERGELNESIVIENLKLKGNLAKYNNEILIIVNSEDSYDLLVGGNKILENGKPNILHKEELYEIEIDILEAHEKPQEVELLYWNDDYLISLYSNLVNVASVNPRSFNPYGLGGLIRVSMNSSEPEKAKAIINRFNEIYIKKNVEAKSEKATKAIEFIDTRLTSVNEILEENKLRLNQFQEINSSLNLDLETTSIIEFLSDAQAQLATLELEEVKIRGSYTTTNPLYQNIQSQKKVLQDQINEIEDQIKSLPSEQQEYIDLYREVEVTEGLYKELLNRKLNFSIMEASTLGNIRVIDSAFTKFLISPRISSAIYAILFGFFVGVAVGLFRGIYLSPISNPAEITDSTASSAPIMGIFPFISDGEENDVKIENTRRQSIESLFLNIKKIIDPKKGKIILITSPSPTNGKSYTSNALARRLSELGNKTLLIDCDLKKGDQHVLFEKDVIKLSELESINKEEDLESLKIKENLYFIPRIKNLRNSFNWLDSLRFKSLLEDICVPAFDYIVVDTAPFLSVSDTSLLMGKSDINLLVVRHELTKRGEIAQCLNNSQQIGQDFDGFIYNAYQKPTGYFGYYQYYGNYSYQYYADKYLYQSYDYEN